MGPLGLALTCGVIEGGWEACGFLGGEPDRLAQQQVQRPWGRAVHGTVGAGRCDRSLLGGEGGRKEMNAGSRVWIL